MRKIAVVTGANRGIGFEVCRQLARQKDILVVLTSRDGQKGQEAVQHLKKEGLSVNFFQLDVTSDSDIGKFCQSLERDFGRCDILVNNAGILIDEKDAKAGNAGSVLSIKTQDILETMATNVFGPLRMCQVMVPLMKRNNYGRIVNMSSGMGQLSDMNGEYTAYRISKVSLNALTRILYDELKGTNILVNSMCPGWVRTEMGGPNATRSVEEGADTALWLATLPDKGPSGKFFRDRKEIAW